MCVEDTAAEHRVRSPDTRAINDDVITSKGDFPLRYFLEPAVLTANYAFANGYEKVSMAGLSGGGWSTTFASAIDKRISASFPIAGSVPCAMRNPNGLVPGQKWTGTHVRSRKVSYRSLANLSWKPGEGWENSEQPPKF